MYLKGNGCNSSSIPIYQSETCRGPVRGALVCLNNAVTILGLVIVSATLKVPRISWSNPCAGLLVGLRNVICRRVGPMATSYWYVPQNITCIFDNLQLICLLEDFKPYSHCASYFRHLYCLILHAGLWHTVE